MKGQFFMVAVTMLMLMFYIGISVYLSPSYSGPQIKEDISNLFENIKNEYPKVFNLGLEDSAPAETLVNFTGFVKSVTSEKVSRIYILWLITENVSDDLNVTVGNFLGYDANVTVNVSGDAQVMDIENGKTDSYLFTSAPSEFQLVLNFNNTESNLLLEKYKANFYSILDMRKGDDKIIGEITA